MIAHTSFAPSSTAHPFIRDVTLDEALRLRRQAYPLTSRAAIRALDALRRSLQAVLPLETILCDITPTHIQSLLQPHTHPTTWNNVLRQARAFFAWCIRSGFLRESPALSFQMQFIPYHEPTAYSTAQVEQVFGLLVRSGAAPGVGIALTLGFFCGMRSAEIQRTTRGEIHLDEETVRVSIPKGFFRGVPPRLIQAPRNAILWLRFFLGDRPYEANELVAASPQELAAWKRANLAPKGLSWGQDQARNVMRHTACTMHVAAFRNLAETQLFLGHSRGSDVTVRHYLGLVSQREAERYWHIYPPLERSKEGAPQRSRRGNDDPRFKLVEVTLSPRQP